MFNLGVFTLLQMERMDEEIKGSEMNSFPANCRMSFFASLDTTITDQTPRLLRYFFLHFEWIVSTVQLNQVTSSFSAFTLDLTMEYLLRANNLSLGETVNVLTLVRGAVVPDEVR